MDDLATLGGSQTIPEVSAPTELISQNLLHYLQSSLTPAFFLRNGLRHIVHLLESWCLLDALSYLWIAGSGRAIGVSSSLVKLTFEIDLSLVVRSHELEVASKPLNFLHLFLFEHHLCVALNLSLKHKLVSIFLILLIARVLEHLMSCLLVQVRPSGAAAKDSAHIRNIIISIRI